MRIGFILSLFLILIIPEAKTQGHQSGTVILHDGGTVFAPDGTFKEGMEKPFHIEAVFETGECSNSLIAIEVHNAHPPLTWYELDNAGQRVHTLFNPQLNYFNDHTTYLVQDMSQHTDTIFIDFDQVLAVRSINPNPHREVLFIEYSAIEPVEVHLSLADMSGRRVMHGVHLFAAGENRMGLNLGSLEQGIYFLSLDGQCIRERMKLIHLD